jgi:hypothetical protein
MDLNLTEALALLERTPRALDAFLRGMPDIWTQSNEGGSSWTPFDIVGHLVHCERADWMPRIERILHQGESQPFEPLDREAQNQDSRGKTIDTLLSEFADLRAGNLDLFRQMNLGPQDLLRRGLHPALGPVTLSNLLATWAAHDMTHLHQLSRVLAHQYREAVGPWSKFLGVLQCNGHSVQA